ncbi:ATP-binding protein [Desulforegula conservatrix]|uniref:ATP-binding protein n=1 Tax=Desulforegula conservatrix TaxID=153026 RepID=UPI00040865CC|nr:ATP-binding protein [Desulforegula conservatrix]
MKQNRFSLRARLFVLLGLMIFQNIAGPCLTIYFTVQTKNKFTSVIERDMESLLNAMRLEKALVMQKGFATYYFLTGSKEWLESLKGYHEQFNEALNRSQNNSSIEQTKIILNEIESRYVKYVEGRERVISLYSEGKKEEGANLHWKVREQFFAIYNLCENYKKVFEEHINLTKKEYDSSFNIMIWILWLSLPSGLGVGLLCSFVLYKKVFVPIRRLATGEGKDKTSIIKGDELVALKVRVKGLEDNFDETKSLLEESREHLMQTEKLALIGKLAAGVAHSVRNPLTSVKMRLFSLQRDLRLNEIQKEDFEVISEEIRHIDTILKNFLEFSRSPKLKLQFVSPSDVVDMTLVLLKHRLESYETEVDISRENGRLPLIKIDQEHLKEALVNILINACDAIIREGKISIMEYTKRSDNGEKLAVIKISDNGPGIPEKFRDKIFDPFFTQKEEGTGLGLSIAAHIIQRHGGKLTLLPDEPGRGAVFEISLPFKEEESD